MKQYLKILAELVSNANPTNLVNNRTDYKTWSLFGKQMSFDLNQGFPLLTTKEIHFHSVKHELLWFLKGSSNTEYLTRNNVKIWNEWADEKGELGPVYGVQWRKWQGEDNQTHDQIAEIITAIKQSVATKIQNRRLILNAWNVAELNKMALPPCHLLAQFFVNHADDNKLSCMLYQRSCDYFLGVPFNIASYSLLTHMIAQVCNIKVDKFIHILGDCHLYENHLEHANLQLSRKAYNNLATLKLNQKIMHIDDFSADDIEILNYQHHPKINAPIAI